MKALVTILICTLLTACATQRNAEKYYAIHPEKLAEQCTDKFPVKDSVVVIDIVHFDTLFIAGEPVILKDSFYIKGDTIVKQVTKECPKVQTITKTVTHDSIIYRRDMAMEYMLNSKIEEQGKQITELQTVLKQSNEGRSRWRLWCLITWGICAVFIGFKIVKPRLPFIG